MKTFIFIGCLLISATALAQSEEGPEKKVAFGFGINMGLDMVDPLVTSTEGISDNGFTWLDMSIRMNVMKYFNANAGFTLSRFKDKLPFTQAVTFSSGSLSGLPSNSKSRIVAGGFYYSLGVSVPIKSQLHWMGAFGSRSFSATRKITSCTDCNEVDLNVESGNYLQTGLALIKADDITTEVHLLYSHYLGGDFQNTITLGITGW